MTESSIVEILDVGISELNTEQLWNFVIDLPKKGEKFNTYSLEIIGWALGKQCPVIAIELVSENRVVRKVAVNINRQGVPKLYPEVSWTARCGFSIEIGVIGLPLKGELNIRAVLENKSNVIIGTVHYIRQAVRSNYRHKLEPLIFTSSGRSGTTWLMQLLSQHPAIICGATYPYETRVAQYWMQMLMILSQPRNLLEYSQDKLYQEFEWVGPNPFYSNSKQKTSEGAFWLGHDYPEELAAFCQQNIDKYYQALASSYGKIVNKYQITYFLEKYLPNPTRKILLEVYPSAREIILVRDFRDICCSVLAFNTKRGYVAFGRDRVESDRDYIRTTIKSTAANMLQLWRQRKEQAYVLRYEDLILAPEETLSSIFEYLGLDNSSLTISKILETASKDTPQLKRHRTSASPQESIGRWQQDLEPSLQALCTEVCKDALQEFGYSVTGEYKLYPLSQTVKPSIKSQESLIADNSTTPNRTDLARKKLEKIKSQVQNIRKALN